MPKARSICTIPGCPNLAIDGRCPVHTPQRPSRISDGYDQDWIKLSKAILVAYPRCAACGDHATMVDHIIPKKQGGTNDLSNLQPMCRSCHSSKSAKEGSRWGPRYEAHQVDYERR